MNNPKPPRITNTFFVFFVVFIMMFGVKFNGINILELVALAAFSYIILSMLSRKSIKTSKGLVFFYMLGFFQVFLYLITIILNNYQESSQLKVILVFFFAYPIIIFTIIKLFRLKIENKNIIKIFIAVIFFQLLLAAIITFNADARSLLLGMIDVDFARLNADAGRRLVGFGSSYFHLGTILSLGFFLCIYVFKELSNTVKEKVFYLLLASIFMLFAVFAARTSLVILAIVILVYLPNYRQLLSFIISKRNLTSYFYYLLFSLIALFALLTIYFINLLPAITSFIDRSLPWAFEFVFNLMAGKSLATDSSNHLFNEMYFLPDNLKTFLIGDGKMFSDVGGYYTHTDAGYVRQLFSYGLLGLLASLAVYFYIFKTIAYKYGKHFSYTLLLIVLVMNIKGSFIYYSNYEFFIMFLFITALLSKQYRVKA